MTWYAVYDKQTKELVSTGSVIEPMKLETNLEYVELNEDPDFSRVEWNKDTLSLVEKHTEEILTSSQVDKLDLILLELAEIKAMLRSR